MIHSLFICNSAGDIFFEKHWRKVIPRSVCDYFYEAHAKAQSDKNVNPVIQTPHHNLISIFRNDVYLIAVCINEISPLFVIEFLHRVVDILEEYFSSATETSIKENTVKVYEILDEMLDNGFPLATESNILMELIRPPNLLRALTDTMTGRHTGLGSTLPSGQLSNVPWRRAGVKYVNNEAFFDVIEEIDVIIDRTGSTVLAEAQGYIDCLVKLSGMPDLLLTFINPHLLDDVSFHPCVRYKRWEEEKVLSFVPPDGHFRLIRYHVGSVNAISIPLYVRHSISFREKNSRIELTVLPKLLQDKAMEDVRLEITMPKSVLSMSLTNSIGKYSFDPASKLLSWDLGKLDNSRAPTLKGNISLQPGMAVPECNPIINVFFSIQQYTASGLRVNRMDLRGERYKPYKGVKYISKAGRYQIRT